MTDDDKANALADKLLKGAKPHTISEEAGDEFVAASARRKYLEKKYKLRLAHISVSSIDLNDANNRNIENAVGAVQLPLGFTEIRVNGQHIKNSGNDKSLVFLATTEGKLVAGANRGASAINKSGGAKVQVLKNGMTRSVVVETESISDSVEATRYVGSKEGVMYIQKAFAESMRYGKLQNVETYTTGRLLFIVYSADTSAAMGMNMLTISSSLATRAIVQKLAAKGIKAKILAESANMCADKKPSMINVIKGRGISVVAEAVIKKEVLTEYFKASAKQIEELNYAKNYVGSSLAGSISHNAHAANIIAAVFIAYGQDPAQVTNSATAFDDAKALDNGDLYISTYLPSLEIGTYGGGTRRETQKELLTATGVYGEGDSKGETKLKFAEIIAAAVLAGELNLLAAQAGMELSSSHATLKRG